MMSNGLIATNQKLSPEVFTQVLLFSRGAIVYLVEHNFPQDNEEGLLGFVLRLPVLLVRRVLGRF